MTKWEITCASDWDAAKALASEGWELVSVNQSNGDDWMAFYFKRPVEKK